MSVSRSVLVVGAGIFGVTAALELCRRNYKVKLIDPGPLPHARAASTDISKAIRMDYGADEFYMRLMEEVFQEWDRWKQMWREPLFHEDGFLFLTRERMQPGDFEFESFRLLRARGHSAERMDSETLKARFPVWVAEKYTDGYFNPRAGWVESSLVVRWLIERARDAGVDLVEGQRAVGLIEERQRIAGIRTADGSMYRADFTIVAAGAWTPILLPHLSDFMWIVGQPVFHFHPDNPADYQAPRFAPWGADISRTGWYGFPALKDGTLKVGNHGPGHPVHPDAPREVSPEDVEECRAFLRETFPTLSNARLTTSRLCLYCDTWDGDFYIDHDPTRPGLMIATGGSGHGFKFAPVLGRIIADVLEQKPNPWAARFAWRKRGEPSKEGARHK